MKLKFVTLEDGNNYMIMREEIKNDITYLYLVNENDSSDFCIRKVITEGDQKYLAALENDEEFNYALGLFNKN